MPRRAKYRPVRPWLLAAWLGLSCSAPSADVARRGVVVQALLNADEVQLRARPGLMAGKYRHMASAPYEFYRGSFFLFLRDSKDTSQAVGENAFAIDEHPYGIGDAHLENFGLLHGEGDALTLELNDFDAADRWPFEVDLRRLTVSLLVGSRSAAGEAKTEDEERSIVHAALQSYVHRIRACAGAEALEDEAPESESPHLVDLRKRALRDGSTRVELQELTRLDGNARTLKRGHVDPEDPESVLTSLPDWAVAALPQAFASYTQSLVVAPPPPEFFDVLDAVREFGGGVASWPRVRVLVLVRGPSDDPADDVILEVKEAFDSGASTGIVPGRFFDSLAQRVGAVQNAAWSRPGADPLWGLGTWLDLRVQIRSESEWNKNLRTSRFEDDRASTDGLVDLATRLGSRIGNMHSAPINGKAPCFAIADRVEDGTVFVDHETGVARAYADQVFTDYDLFKQALTDRGELLGYPRGNLTPPSREVAALFGDPPAVTGTDGGAP